MRDYNKDYQYYIKGFTYIAKPDEWFVEGTKAEIDTVGNYCDYEQGDTFNAGFSCFTGLTNETFEEYVGQLPREDGEICPLEEFYMFDDGDNEVSELTIEEYEERYFCIYCGSLLFDHDIKNNYIICGTCQGEIERGITPPGYGEYHGKH